MHATKFRNCKRASSPILLIPAQCFEYILPSFFNFLWIPRMKWFTVYKAGFEEIKTNKSRDRMRFDKSRKLWWCIADVENWIKNSSCKSKRREKEESWTGFLFHSSMKRAKGFAENDWAREFYCSRISLSLSPPTRRFCSFDKWNKSVFTMDFNDFFFVFRLTEGNLHLSSH